MDHKVQHHRTFRKPKQLEGLPPGTKVTIRASVGSINTVPSPTSSVCTSPTTTLPPTPKGKNANTKSNQSSAAKSNANHSKPKPTAPPKKKKKKKPVAANTTKRVKMVNTALRNLRCSSGVHKCIECKLEIKDFEGHFHTYMHCSKCKFSTSCNKAYMNHMVRFHGRNSNKKSSASKKTSIDKRSRNKSPVGARAVYDKKNLKDAKVEGVTKKSIKKKKLPVRKKASNTSRNNKLKQVGTNKFLRKKHITSVEKVNDSDKPALDSCSTNSDVEKAESLDTDNKNDFDNVQDKPEQLSCRDADPELGQSSDTKAFVDNAGASKATLSNMAVKMEDHNDLNLPGEEDVSFEQFLRKRDEPESMSSDISEQGSVHLEPLTPSEVLEHEATEILQKGNVTSCSNKGQTSEQADDTKESSTVTSTMVKSEEDNEDC
ncbi:hypothetical protein FKM82_004700 [Ascaphus truei]